MIKKTSNGTYRVSFSTRDKRGRKIKKEKSGIGSFARAKQIEYDLIAELKNKREGFEYSGYTFESFFYDVYLPYCEASFTDGAYMERTVNKWCQSIYKVKLDAISPNDILEIMLKAPENLSYGTLKKIRSYLSRIFIYACNGGLKFNPCSTVKIPKRKEVFQAKVLTKDEANILLRKSKELKPVWYKIWAFHLFTGVRSGEGYALLKTDVDVENLTISISKGWSSKLGFKSTKNGDWRIVPIANAIKSLVIELLADNSTGEFLLPHPWQWSKGDQARVLRQFCQGIGITPIRFHDLRATFITQMFANGASIGEVQAIVGHSELRTTQMYLRLAGVTVKGATNKLSFSLPVSDVVKNVVSLRDRVELFGT